MLARLDLTARITYVFYLTYVTVNMDKIISARVDEWVARRIGLLAQQLGTSKKRVLENAIRQYADSVERDRQKDVLDHTFGAWNRSEAPETTVERSREAFRRSMLKRHK
jgi:predicted transcriptional regulator